MYFRNIYRGKKEEIDRMPLLFRMVGSYIEGGSGVSNPSDYTLLYFLQTFLHFLIAIIEIAVIRFSD